MLALLVLASAFGDGSFEPEALRPNQVFGFERNCARPDDGDGERGLLGDVGVTGARVSA